MKNTTRLHFGCFNCPREGWLSADVNRREPLFVEAVK